MDVHQGSAAIHKMKLLDSSSQVLVHQMVLQICKIHNTLYNMLYLDSMGEFVGAHLNKFTHRFEVEHEAERIVYFLDLQYHLVYGDLTARIKELHLVDGSRSLMYIHLGIICRLVVGMDEFVMDHIFVLGSNPGATLAIDMGNGIESSLNTSSESEDNCFKIIKRNIIAGVGRCVGSITVPSVGYHPLRKGLEGAYRAWLRETRSG
ncbi:hypothetical protein SO802_018971 [Lithocarpus litseifolius]|uniref:Maturase K n=1 Tax=Lithocarpus litseifolius TaxID=425828 RepID=A0AAW2CMW1_9ROSI